MPTISQLVRFGRRPKVQKKKISGSAAMPAKTRRLPASENENAEETELSPAQSRLGTPVYWTGSHRLYRR